ncbi:AI-2E family transporter [Atopobacter phocae]|uniref:AI-2E family transporter n=1 Tax=Atopobacter phocae TaxID=136492 RepID=UPI000470EEE7|nr:AI-2E family transporter [Atopobacter phocae]
MQNQPNHSKLKDSTDSLPIDKQLSTRYIQLLGGRNTLFTLVTLLLIGLVIFIFNQIPFVFYPLQIIFKTVTLPILLAVILYYLFVPLVNYLERKGLKRVWGASLALLIILSVFAGTLAFLIPLIITQVQQFLFTLPQTFNNLIDWSKHAADDSIFQEGVAKISSWLQNNLDQLPEKLMQSTNTVIANTSVIFSQVSSVSIALVTAPIIFFFLLKDTRTLRNSFLTLFPKNSHQSLMNALQSMNQQVGAYIQGQLIVAFCIAVLLFIGYLIIGLDYGLALAALAGITSVIPYVGPFIACVPAVLIAGFTSQTMLLKMIIVWIVVQVLEGNLISPNVMGKKLQMHPVTVILVISIMGNLMGLTGMILGVPLFSILKVVSIGLFRAFRYRYNYYYGDNDNRFLDWENMAADVTETIKEPFLMKLKHTFILDPQDRPSKEEQIWQQYNNVEEEIEAEELIK